MIEKGERCRDGRGRNGEGEVMSLQSRILGCRGWGIRAEKDSCGKRLRSLEYITDTNLEKTSVSADELPGSLQNLFLPSSPQAGYDRD